MKLINFQISKYNNGIDLDGEGHLDLHNDFLLTGLNYAFGERQLELLFLKAEEDWVREYPFKSIKFIFTDVEFLRMKEMDQSSVELYKDDDKTLSQIGYAPREEPEFRGVLATDYSLRKTEFSICFYTENDQAFSVYASEVLIKTYT